MEVVNELRAEQKKIGNWKHGWRERVIGEKRGGGADIRHGAGMLGHNKWRRR